MDVQDNRLELLVICCIAAHNISGSMKSIFSFFFKIPFYFFFTNSVFHFELELFGVCVCVLTFYANFKNWKV